MSRSTLWSCRIPQINAGALPPTETSVQKIAWPPCGQKRFTNQVVLLTFEVLLTLMNAHCWSSEPQIHGSLENSSSTKSLIHDVVYIVCLPFFIILQLCFKQVSKLLSQLHWCYIIGQTTLVLNYGPTTSVLNLRDQSGLI